jgi:hypothetical protein
MAIDTYTFDPKDPDEKSDYQFDWASKFLATGETISATTWTLTSGITKQSDTKTTGTTTIWLTGGTDGSDYDIANKITTSAGRIFERTATIPVRSR